MGEEEAVLVASSPGPRKALVLGNHGLPAVGGSVDAAVWWSVAVERACGVQPAAAGRGQARARRTRRRPAHPRATEAVRRSWNSSKAGALRTRGQPGTGPVARMSCRPLYEQVAAAEPELFE